MGKNMELTKENFDKTIKVIDNELFMRHLVFKSKPKTYQKKKEEMEFVKEFLIICWEAIE